MSYKLCETSEDNSTDLSLMENLFDKIARIFKEIFYFCTMILIIL
jgi:hypothetical protein